ncbi:MAG: hypothetical protein QOF62_3203 [Pyrinomonadaceae bacterium]|jgi:uncharacterized repeat protein (TIGR01451 family)|nr:hypothetical protein [Pyrinomonadaceae bacterium]
MVEPLIYAQVHDCNLNNSAFWSDEPVAYSFSCGLAPRDSVGDIAAYVPGFPELNVLVTLSGGYWIGNLDGGYTTQGSPNCSSQNFSPVLKIHLSKPVRTVSVGVLGTGFTATNNKGESVTVTNNTRSGFDFVSYGITDITLTNNDFNADGSWYMAFTGVSFRLEPWACESCSASAISKPASQPLASNWPAPVKNWSMQTDVTDNDGLVVTNIKLGERYMTEKISVPYYTLQTSAFSLGRGQLSPSGDPPSMRSRIVNYNTYADGDKLVVEATYIVDRIPATSQSCLHITQRYEFYREGVLPCEPSGELVCSNYRALVSYKFVGSGGETLTSINIPQRNRSPVKGYAKDTVGLFRDCDGLINCLSTGGLLFKDKQNPLFTEHKARVIKDGKNTGTWDNLHQTYQGVVDEPLDLSRLAFAGCPECLHMHWRWGASTLTDAQRYNNFQVYIPVGSNQDLDFAIVRNHAGEEDPTDYSTLSNQEPIRHPTTGFDLREQSYDYTAPDDVVLWYSATGHQSEDTFFIHPEFFNPSEADLDATITRNTSSPLTGRPESLVKDSQAFSVATAGQNEPISIHFPERYQDGPTTFTDLDPTTVSPLPIGYATYNNASYDVETSALVSGPHTVTFDVSSVNDQTIFNTLRVLHAEKDVGDPARSIWVDRTILSPDTPVSDFASRKIYSRSNTLGGFVIATAQPQPPSTATADLAVTVTDSSDPIVVGNNLTYTIKVTNKGPQAASEIVLIDGLSPDVDFVSAASTQGTCNHSEGNVACKLNSLLLNATATVTLIVKPAEITLRTSSGPQTITDTALVRAKQPDPISSNNSVTENTTISSDGNIAPVVSITNPTIGSLFVGPANISVTANASDGGGAISKVEFYDAGTLLGTGTVSGANLFSFSWNNVPFGQHSLVAVATDNMDKKTSSSPISIVVNGSALVSITNLDFRAPFKKPANIPIIANASENGGTIIKTDFYANGALIGTGAVSGVDQYSMNWNDPPAGRYALIAVATDNSGVTTTSPTVTITVNDPPGVFLTTPTVVSNPVTLFANASDRDGYINEVDFYINGTQLIRGSATGAYQYSAQWANVASGNYVLTAVATDNYGATTTSLPMNLTVTSPPSVTLTSPTNGSNYNTPASVTLTANASDSDGTIAKVEYFANGAFVGLGTLAGTNQYSFTWSNVPIGNYTVTALATDNSGGTMQTAGVTIKVTSPALLVAGSTTLNTSDAAIKARLEALNYVVTVKDGTSVTTADATGKAVVVISSTVTPASVGTKFRAVNVPVVTWESGLFTNMGMTGSTNKDFGTLTKQTQVKILNAAHPMAAGLSGTVSVVTTSGTFGWGKPNANAAAVATAASDATKTVIFGYATGAVMPGLTAPARRVGLFMFDTTATGFTTNGGVLFDAAIKWATGRI